MHYHCQNQHNNKYRYKEWTLWILCIEQQKKKKKFIFISKISKRERKTSITYIHTSCGNSHFSLARSQSICQKQNTNPLFKKRYTRKFSNNLSISCLESLEISGPKKPKFRFFFLTSFLFATISWEPNTPKKEKKEKKIEAKIVRQRKNWTFGRGFLLEDVHILYSSVFSERERERVERKRKSKKNDQC